MANLAMSKAPSKASTSGTLVRDSVIDPPVEKKSTPKDLVGLLLLDRYHILEKLGEGGMGVVYLAEHTTIKKRFAIKVLSDEFAHKQELVDRFLQEARAASMIEHENVVEITDFGQTPTGSVFFVMEMLTGEDLSETLAREGPLPWERIKGIFLQICRALDAAHKKGIVHRDMKPENCFRILRGGNKDFIKVLDFGIAKVNSGPEATGKGLTRTGMIFGTPEYMSPEQAQGIPVDHRSDIYSLGVIMYELMTGKVPFSADSFMGVLSKHMFEAPEAPRIVAPSVQINPEAEAIVLKALQKDRDLRFQSMEEFMEAIVAVGTGLGPVSVVQENLQQPLAKGSMMGFSDSRSFSATNELQLSSGKSSGTRKLLWIMVALIIGAGAAGIYVFTQENASPRLASKLSHVALIPKKQEVLHAKNELVSPKNSVADENKTIHQGAPPTEEKSLDLKDAAKVRLTIRTNVDAELLDARDRGSYGLTNSEEGILLDKSNSPQKFILVAPGYEELPFDVVPNVSKGFSYKLKKIKTSPKETKEAKPGKEKVDKKPDSKDSDASQTKESDASTDAKPEKSDSDVISPELKNPFNK